MTDLATPTIDTKRLERMIEISRRLNSTTNIDELLNLIITEAATMLGTESASIMLLDPRTRELRFRAMAGEMPPELDNVPVPLEGSIAGTILRSNEPLIVDNVADNPSWNSNVDQAINFQTTAILGVPVHDASLRPIGVLEALNKLDKSRFTDVDIAVLSTLADLAGAAIGKARLFVELEKAYQKLNDLDRLKSDFIALASHELRTPLSIILGYVSFLREEADSVMAAQLDNVLQAAVRLRSLIQDMLNLQYVDTGEQSLKLQSCDLVELVRVAVGRQQESAAAHNQQMTFTTAEPALMLEADRDMLEIVIGNLLNNAVKFTPAKGRVDVTLELRGNEAWIIVRDSGVGIPQNQLERIFDRFYQVEPHINRRFEGMGIGLSVVKELVGLHHGRIWAESEQGKGATFTVALPLSQSET